MYCHRGLPRERHRRLTGVSGLEASSCPSVSRNRPIANNAAARHPKIRQRHGPNPKTPYRPSLLSRHYRLWNVYKMLRASLGVFRAVGVRQAAPARASARASTYSTAGQLWKRQISQKSGSESTPWRLTTTSRQASQTAWQRIGGHSPFSRAAPSKTAFRGQRRNFHSSKARNSESKTHESTAEPSSLSARLKKLSREYGWSAVGIYFALSVLDFPFCFLLVRTVGTDRIGMGNNNSPCICTNSR